MAVPAEKLLGQVLDGDWTVIAKKSRPAGSTGGTFSVGYIVESPTGNKGFLKALDYSSAMSAFDPALALNALTSAYLFERELLYKCKNDRLNRVVLPITDGTIKVDNSSIGKVQYIIFELADSDVRSYMNFSKKFDLAWTLRALHHIATGLFELHYRGIAHQDVKPSNVLFFQGRGSKITDLGRGAYQGLHPPHETIPVAGDLSYAPPELLYRYVPVDWNQRRFGCDLYLLGSMVVFFFTGISATSLIVSELKDFQHWRKWTGTFQQILPDLQNAFSRGVETFKSHVDDGFRADLIVIVRQLCEPNPDQRGHPLNLRARNPQSLERYISAFNILARRAELGMKGGVI